jgi:hypothetical protein
MWIPADAAYGRIAKQNPPKQTNRSEICACHPCESPARRANRTRRPSGGASCLWEPQWVLELKDASRISIPLSWAELVEEPTGRPAILEAERPFSRTVSDAKGYLNLAKMVCQLKMNQLRGG